MCTKHITYVKETTYTDCIKCIEYMKDFTEYTKPKSIEYIKCIKYSKTYTTYTKTHTLNTTYIHISTARNTRNSLIALHATNDLRRANTNTLDTQEH